MTEGKAPLTNRLRREGRWDEASAWKDAEVRRLCAEGMRRAEAKEAAWEPLAKQFPPLAIETPEDAIGTPWLDDGLQQGTPGDCDYHADVSWVYQHLSVTSVAAADAPSSGAWAMLQWARNNPQKFFESVLPKAAAVRPSEPQPPVYPPDDPHSNPEYVFDDMQELIDLLAWHSYAMGERDQTQLEVE